MLSSASVVKCFGFEGLGFCEQPEALSVMF